MAVNTLESVFNAARGFLHDTTPSTGAVWTDSALQVHFNEPYRALFNCLMGASKRVQRVVYVNFPAYTTVLIPANFGIPDLSEPEMVEERLANPSIAIVSTSATTPIEVNAPGHGLGSTGNVVAIQVTGVVGTPAPWGNWFATVVDANNFTLNGSMTDGVAGVGGSCSIQSQNRFTEVIPIDLSNQGLDGIPGNSLNNYLWIDEQMQFLGCVNTQELRITYWASGTPPTNTALNINIDNCIDFLSVGTAANAAYANGWNTMGDRLYTKAYGAGGDNCTGGLLGAFVKIQVAEQQRGPTRRRLPFRPRRTRYGDAILG